MPALLHVERHAQKARENVERELAGAAGFWFWQLDLLGWFDWQARTGIELAKYRSDRGTGRVANRACRRQDARAI